MIRHTAVVLAALFIPSFLFAGAGKPDIVVITQNQYLGADLTPIIAGQSPGKDVWNLRPGKPPGNTCCEAADLSNNKSILDERIDVVFSLMPPSRVKANILNNNPDDKTPSGLWPSDHATVAARLYYGVNGGSAQ